MSRRIVFGGLVVALIGLLAAPAWAHVSVSPSDAPRGSFTTLTFQVPNEKEDATTKKVEVQFPQDQPIADASVQAIAGWKIEVTKKSLETPVTTDEGDTLNEAIDTITWTAEGDGIQAGYFEQFKVSVGLPEDGDSLTFPTLQTYSDGDVVRWIQTEEAGGEEPENPAPTLALTEVGEDDHGATATTAPVASGGASTVAVKNAQDDADTAKKIAIVGIVVGAGGILGAFAALLRKRPIT